MWTGKDAGLLRVRERSSYFKSLLFCRKYSGHGFPRLMNRLLYTGAGFCGSHENALADLQLERTRLIKDPWALLWNLLMCLCRGHTSQQSLPANDQVQQRFWETRDSRASWSYPTLPPWCSAFSWTLFRLQGSLGCVHLTFSSSLLHWCSDCSPGLLWVPP